MTLTELINEINDRIAYSGDETVGVSLVKRSDEMNLDMMVEAKVSWHSMSSSPGLIELNFVPEHLPEGHIEVIDLLQECHVRIQSLKDEVHRLHNSEELVSLRKEVTNLRKLIRLKNLLSDVKSDIEELETNLNLRDQ